MFIFNIASVRRKCFDEHINYLTDCDVNIDQNKASDALTRLEAINAKAETLSWIIEQSKQNDLRVSAPAAILDNRIPSSSVNWTASPK